MTNMSEITAALATMRELAKSPKKKAEMQTAWDNVCSQLEAHYLGMKPLPKRFEVHHMNETARARFALAISEGHSMTECARLAVERIVGTG